MKNYDVLFDEIVKCNIKINELEWEAELASQEDDWEAVNDANRRCSLILAKKASLCKLYDMNY